MKATAAGLLVLAGLSTAQADEPRRGTLTLACTGTRTDATQTDAKPEPVSMGITIDFNTRAVAGFGSDGIVITDSTEMILTFGGSGVGDSTSISGTLDWVTYAIKATFVGSMKDRGPRGTIRYSLQCTPTQRTF
jgi:hypothetical protein